MKTLFTLFCFSLISSLNSFGQTNPLKDDILHRQKEHQYIRQNKLKEAVTYLYQYNDGSTTYWDTILVSRYHYTEDGYLSWVANYHPSLAKPQPPPNTFTYTYVRDKKGNVTQLSLANTSFGFNRLHEVIKYNLSFDDTWSEYEYDEHNNPVKSVDHPSKFEMDNIKTLSDNFRRPALGYGTTYFTYDDQGNLACKKSNDVDNKYNYNTNYTYNNKNQLVSIAEIKRDSAMRIISNINTSYQYRYEGDELIKTESTYDGYKNLVAQKEFIYDKHGNQLKGYEMGNGAKRLFWNYKFNKNNQVIESVGGPSVFFFPTSRDIRRNDLAHFFYTYDEAGNLTEIKKYQRDNYGEEKLTAIEKITYTTW